MTFAEAFLDSSSPGFRGHLRGAPTRANMQPAVAWYLRGPAESTLRALSVDVLRVENGKVAEITGFVLPGLFPAFGLSSTL
jgi:RNA polymerase sigma-70 factor (ECF subfamily)